MCAPAAAIAPLLIASIAGAGISAGASAVIANNNKPATPQLPKPGALATTPVDPGRVKYGAGALGSTTQAKARKGKTGLTIPLGGSMTGGTGGPSTGVGY
jgi:hypothetical protein